MCGNINFTKPVLSIAFSNGPHPGYIAKSKRRHTGKPGIVWPICLGLT
jgi:hypothetical protein